MSDDHSRIARLEEGIKSVCKALDDIKAAAERDAYSGNGFLVAKVDKNGFEMLDNEKIEYSEREKGDLRKLFQKSKDLLNFSAEKIKDITIDSVLKEQFISLSGSLENIVGCIATISNKMSARHACEAEPLRHHCLLCVNSGFALVQFILEVYNNKKNKN